MSKNIRNNFVVLLYNLSLLEVLKLAMHKQNTSLFYYAKVYVSIFNAKVIIAEVRIATLKKALLGANFGAPNNPSYWIALFEKF